MLWAYFGKLPVGHAPFAGFSGATANALLKACCVAVKLTKARSFTCHDLRRGHAKDLQQAGATLKEILEAGQWTSPRFLAYLDLDELEKDVVVDAHLAESDEEG